MQTYHTRDGDMLDWICHKHYGRTEGAVEAVFEVNPGLADKGPIYEAGLLIKLPDLAAAQTKTVVRLWD